MSIYRSPPKEEEPVEEAETEADLGDPLDVMEMAYEKWPMNPDLRMPDGARVVDTIADLTNGVIESSDYGDIVEEAAAGRWDAVRARFARYEWTPDDLARQQAYWGAEVQRLAMLPAFIYEHRVWYSRQLQVFLASAGLRPDAKLGRGAFGVAHLVCPAVAPGACSLVLKIQRVVPEGNEEADILREYEILRYVNRAEPDLAPQARTGPTKITDAVNSDDPSDVAEFVFFGMDQWSGSLESRMSTRVSRKIVINKPVLTAFFAAVTRLFQTDIGGTLDVRRRRDGRRVRYITNLDGLTARNVLFIENSEGEIVRLGISDWGWISDPTDPGENLGTWLAYKRSSKMDPALLTTNPITQRVAVQFFLYCILARKGGFLTYTDPDASLMTGPVRTETSIFYRPSQLGPATATKTPREAPPRSLFARLLDLQ